MKRFLLFALFATVANFVHAQLIEDFDPFPSGWILDKGAKFTTVNGGSNGVVLTSGAGNNAPSIIGTPAVNKTSGTEKVCVDVWAVDPNNLDTHIPFPCTNIYMDVLFVNSSVTDYKTAQDPANIYDRVNNYQLSPNGGTQCFTFTFPTDVTASDFKVILSFHGDCGTGGFKFIIDNVTISGVSLICGGTNCPPVALNDLFARGNKAEMSFNGVLFGGNSAYTIPSGYAVDLGGTDNDANDAYADLQWSLVSGPVPAIGSVTVNTDGTFSVIRTSTAVTQITFTYMLTDDGPDNSFATTTDNMTTTATVTINWPAASTLPVSLINFTANRSGSTVTLQWTTNMESNNTGFEIQRSIGNSAYEKVGFVATNASGGNSSTPLFYQFKEQNNAAGTSWYRLVQIDKDGTPTISVAKGVHGIDESARITVYPNPGTSGNTNVLFGSSATRDIIISDLSGKIVKHWSNYHDDNMAITGLDAGVYMLVVINKATSEKQTQKIVIIK